MSDAPHPQAVTAALRDLAVAALQARADLAHATEETRNRAERITADTAAIATVIAGRRQADMSALAGLTGRLNALRRGRNDAADLAVRVIARLARRRRLVRWLMLWLRIRWLLAIFVGITIAAFLFLVFWPDIQALLGGAP